MNTINVWTVAISQWRKAKKLNVPILDITAKSGIKALAPDWYIVHGYKNGGITEDEYTAIYTKKMLESQIKHPEVWEELLTRPRVALGCYCKAGCFCHRLIFAGIMKKYCEDKGAVVNLNGEIQ